MKILEKQFGREFVAVLQKCPTLVKDVAEIRRHKIHIHNHRSESSSYAVPASKSIHLGTKDGVVDALIVLAHEKYHLVDKVLPSARSFKGKRWQFVRVNMAGEVSAILHELKVSRELIAAGYHLPPKRLLWVNLYERGGRKAIYERLKKMYTSTHTDETYPVYYAKAFDEAADELEYGD